jgi:lipid II:glycine glycyltransferase (peptidoglycan interpeptide bridge formation enzyme)
LKTIVGCDDKMKVAWSNYIFTHPHGNIFQTPEMYEIYLRAKNYEPLIITAVDNNENILGVLLAVIQKENSGLFGKFSARSIIIGGPLITDDNPIYLELILGKYATVIKGVAIYTQFRNLWDWTKYKEIFSKNGFNYDSHLNILIDVSELNEMEQGISKNKRRNIVKSKNKGLLFKEITSENEFEKSVDLIISTYKKIGLPCLSKEHFDIAFKELFSLNRLKVFGAFIKDTMIGTRMELAYKDLIYDWYAGAEENESNKYPNDFLIYHILLWSHKNGFKMFDFGGAGKPNKPYGVREHKLKFSNNLVEYGRFECVHNKPLFTFGKLSLSLYQYINDLRK